MTRSEIKVLVDRILREALGPTGFDHAEVRSGPNYDDEESLFINAYFKPGSNADAERPTMRVMGELRRTMIEQDEPRFPYLQYFFPDETPTGIPSESE